MADKIQLVQGEAIENPEGVSVPGGMTKSAAKKEAKRAQMAAFKAAKQSAAPLNNLAAKKEVAKPAAAVKKAVAAPASAYVNNTPKGEKKDMSQEMAAAYDPIAVESAWYDWWEAQGYFKPAFAEDGVSIKPEGSFVIPEPPPNVTGMLHTGHGMMLALQDALIRWQRMLGKTVLFCPGYDHAGISTQSVVEKRLWKSSKQTRHDLGREGLLAKIWEWKEEYQTRITGQTKRLGVSCDWSRVAFTMSPSLSKAVNETFVRFHEEGLIYRANRLVNFCVHLNTTLSNLEVDQIEVPGRKLMNVPGYGDERIEFGVITSFAYPIADSDEKLVVATTRPETMLGDTGIAVHPDDERYKVGFSAA
jgi:valyl-tRNA synthetase